MHDILLPLIHINCPKEIKCVRRITLPDVHATQELKHAVETVLLSISWGDQKSKKDFFICDHYHQKILNIISIIAHELVQWSKFSSYLKVPSSQLSAITLIDQYPHINILPQTLIYCGFDHFLGPTIALSSVYLRGFIAGLIHLSKMKAENQLKMEEEIDVIQSNIRECMKKILDNWKPNMFRIFIIEGLISYLFEIQSVAGGSNNENGLIVNNPLKTIEEIYLKLEILQYCEDRLFHSDLIKELDSLIEEQGAAEEIESHLFEFTEKMEEIDHTQYMGRRFIYPNNLYALLIKQKRLNREYIHEDQDEDEQQ
ncbi:MAG: hypothetical protein EZS28_010559 [Streblomastix strix]|uniref:Uncharacterized protein n=1 Tax=Streblomastix strix TaxID=222440 RepID=A0A5J4WGX3_9EUKA|nr:MAG: hypothetical protein EZS28_010559 [Streblomastix strix]